MHHDYCTRWYPELIDRMRKVERMLWVLDIIGLLLTIGTLTVEIYETRYDLDTRWKFLQTVGIVDVMITIIQYIHHRWHLRFIRADKFIRESNDLLQRLGPKYPMWCADRFNQGYDDTKYRVAMDLERVMRCIEKAYESNFVTQLWVLNDMTEILDNALYVTKD